MSNLDIIINNFNIKDEGTDCRGVEYKRQYNPSKRLIDHTGEKFTFLTALFPVLRPNNNKSHWLCLCECGKIKVVLTSNLVRGLIKSCGCYHSQTCRNHIIEINKEKKENLIGQVFNELEVIDEDLEKTNERKNNDSTFHYYWKCRCIICGTESSFRGDTLKDFRRNYCRTCHQTKSAGEVEVEKILKENNIPFVEQKTFKECQFPDTNRRAKFDFFVDNKYIIEYDGKQHFEDRDREYFNPIRTREHDEIKNLWCYKNNIPIIRIPYTRLGQITIEDLCLETTNFLMEYKNGKFTTNGTKTSLYRRK